MMHVVFVSCCEKKSIKRTRALLDSYARRTGDRTWLTPITQEGLSEINKALRKLATRQTSVACFRNDGFKKMRLLWTVGNSKNFDKNGISPVAISKKKTKTHMPEWAKICALIAETAGFMHDIGKFNQEFQNKLREKGHTQDNVRHEWLSMFLGEELINGSSWDAAVNNVQARKPKFSDKLQPDTLIFKDDLTSAMDALLYCVATHHKLPHKNGDDIDDAHHVNRAKNGDSKIFFENPKIPFRPSQKLVKLIERNIKKINDSNITIKDKVYWRAIATFSRNALILADQSISAETNLAEIHCENAAVAYANTCVKNGKSQLNQELSWHLEAVGSKAGQMIYHMLNIPLPSLSHETIDKINEPARGFYAWQNNAALSISDSVKKSDVPHLVLNMASTGSGKTRMNLRIICALNEEKPIRVATALNLRTLTLQTGDAFHQQVGISKDEMACIIGDLLTQKLHECKEKNVDEDESEDSIDVNSDYGFDLPAWLKFYTSKNMKLGDIIGAPLLVSTIDFLISAGEPHRKHHHILATTRIMHSDLILDEIDGYEPKPLLSVLRLVTVSAMFGRNVVASSATLSKPVARMLWKAYKHGIEMRSLMNNAPIKFKTAIIDNYTKPSVFEHATDDEFINDYNTHVQKMIGSLKIIAYRVPVLAKINTKDSHEWLESINRWAFVLHKAHAWNDPISKKRISFGLIRIANVRTAIIVSNYLSKHNEKIRIVCYHSNHFSMQRFHIERRLDYLLTRKGKNPNEHIFNDSEIRAIIDNNAENDIRFIVVATPVEEIGRDHDFDWAIIEPSSSQSIVQTAGRVNRHRLNSIKEPNIALLQYCYRELLQHKKNKRVFIHPGLEVSLSDPRRGDYSTHPSHDLHELFDWSKIDRIDARMRFSSDLHKFPSFDDDAIEKQSQAILKSMLTQDHLWMAKETYTESSLRSFNPTIHLCLTENEKNPSEYIVSYENCDDEKVSIDPEDPRCNNDWLIKTDLELRELAKEHGVTDKKIMAVSIPYYSENKMEKPSKFVIEKVHRHLSFGFFHGQKI